MKKGDRVVVIDPDDSDVRKGAIGEVLVTPYPDETVLIYWRGEYSFRQWEEQDTVRILAE